MKVKNVFTQGIIPDINNSLKKQDQWEFPTLNARMMNRRGQGLIITNMPGNDKEFEIKGGYVILGACEYNGILYILSKDKNGSNGELGCFPSPKEWTETNTEFERKYKALNNFIPDPIGGALNYGPLNTPLFNLDSEHYAMMFAYPSYDDSVDIFIADYKNPNRIINSNFTQDGGSLKRYYYPESFDGSINLIANSSKIFTSELLSIEYGGNHKPGMYFLFFRYATESFNTTHFIDELGPIPIFEGEGSAVNIYGEQEKNWIANEQNYIDKKITFKLKDLDKTYSFIQIGVMRLSSLIENANATPDVYLINQNIKIPSTGELEYAITGYESVSVLTYEELIKPRLPYTISRDHTNYDNVYYGINWKKPTKTFDSDKFAQLALSIRCEVDYSPNLVSMPPSISRFDLGLVDTGSFFKKDTNYAYAGFAHGEAYPFGIKGVFADGSETDVYPVTGKDYNGQQNSKGIFCFPKWTDEDDSTVLLVANVLTNSRKSLGIKFDLSSAYDFFNLAANEEAFKDIVGFKFVRGERFDNLICQGVGIPCFDHVGLNSGAWLIGFDVGGNGAYVADQAFSVPLYDGRYPIYYQSGSAQYYYGIGQDLSMGIFGTEVTMRMKTKLAIFSPDIMLGKVKSVPAQVYIERIYKVKKNDFDADDDPAGHVFLDPSVIGADEDYIQNYIPHMLKVSTAHDHGTVDAFFINKHTRNAPGNFSSYNPSGFFQYKPSDTETYANRSISIESYIGLKSDDNFQVEADYLSYYNIYKTQPEIFVAAIIESFQPATTTYFSISPVLKLNPDSITRFQGDVFLQKSFFRTHRFYGYQNANTDSLAIAYHSIGGDGSEFVDDWGAYGGNVTWYQWGFLLGILSENFINADLRNHVYTNDNDGNQIKYNFFPNCLRDYESTKQWVALRDIDPAVVEALQVNDGYNHAVSDKKYIGYDADLPDVAMEKRTKRIYHSSKHNPGAIITSFRSIGLSNYVDVDANAGDLMRIFELNDNIFTIQQFAINQHIIKERVTEADDTGSIVLANSTEILPEYYKKLEEFGTQHMRSVIKTHFGIYGVDWINNTIWKLFIKPNSFGKAVAYVKNMTKEFFIKSWWDDIKESYTAVNDITSKLDDDIINGRGIISGYNPFDEHIYISFMLFDNPRNGIHSSNKTLIINDLFEKVIGEIPFSQYVFMNLREDFYSAPYYYELGHNQHAIMKHNDYNKMQTFNGIKHPFRLSFIVNGNDDKESHVDAEKIFNSLQIEMPPEVLTKILYETESQEGEYFFKTTDDPEFWAASEYLENEWHVPVYFQTTTKDRDYDNDSEMRGHWIKITIEYDPTVPEEIYISKVITDFTHSEN